MSLLEGEDDFADVLIGFHTQMCSGDICYVVDTIDNGNQRAVCKARQEPSARCLNQCGLQGSLAADRNAPRRRPARGSMASKGIWDVYV